MIQDRHPKMQALNQQEPAGEEPFAALCARLRAEAEERKTHDLPGVSVALMTIEPRELLRLLDNVSDRGPRLPAWPQERS